jgi:hypothetical protein
MAENTSNRPKDENAFSEGGHTRTRASAPRAKKGNRYPLNLFDLLIIFVLLVAIVLLAMGIRLPDLFGTRESGRACRVEYTLTLQGVDERFAEAILSGDALVTADTGAALGNVTGEVLVAPHRIPALVSAGEGSEASTVVLKEVPGQFDITATVQADAIYTEGVGYTVGDRAIRAGAAYHVRFPNYVGVGVCDLIIEPATSQGGSQ